MGFSMSGNTIRMMEKVLQQIRYLLEKKKTTTTKGKQSLAFDLLNNFKSVQYKRGKKSTPKYTQFQSLSLSLSTSRWILKFIQISCTEKKKIELTLRKCSISSYHPTIEPTYRLLMVSFCCLHHHPAWT